MVRPRDVEPIGPVTFEEFLELEQESELKHELVDGFIYPWGETNPAFGLAGASKRHERIVRNLDYALGPRARQAGCEVWRAETLVRIAARLAFYPDLQIVCDPTDDHEIYNRRPCVVFEVLSRRTSRVDRTEKLTAYRTLESLQAYVIVHQERRYVERHFRDSNSEWQLETITAGSVSIPCVDVDLPLDTVYDGILDD
jgi:Uma2 family endonuclease